MTAVSGKPVSRAKRKRDQEKAVSENGAVLLQPPVLPAEAVSLTSPFFMSRREIRAQIRKFSKSH